jgi:hypothetical protein
MALTVDDEGRKQVAGLWSGSTADAAFSRALVGHLVEKGLSARDGLLAVHDGGPGLDGALRAAWGEQVLVGHCRQQVCVEVLAHLPEKRRPGFLESWRRLWTGGVTDATAGLVTLERDVEREHPGAAARLQRSREALLAVARLGLPAKLTARLGSVSAVRRLLVEASTGQVGAGAAAVAAGLSERLRHQRRLVGYEALHPGPEPPQAPTRWSPCSPNTGASPGGSVAGGTASRRSVGPPQHSWRLSSACGGCREAAICRRSRRRWSTTPGRAAGWPSAREPTPTRRIVARPRRSIAWPLVCHRSVRGDPLPYLPQWAETRESDPIVSGAGRGRGNR